MKKILIFASGSGSNFQAIVEHFQDKLSKYNIEFELLCNKKDAFVFERAKKLNVKSHFVPFSETKAFLESKKYDLYILAGYMRVLPQEVLDFGTFINIHPSLLPKFKGLNAIEQAYNAGEKEAGVTVHYVNHLIDSGEILEQQSVEIKEGMSLEELESEIHKIEHEIYPRVIEKLLCKELINGNV